ncbi:hypothetical protein ASD11_12535 [Aeromicrobium sp. Root495]|nr:hypothetical protein ASD11_12535 [Aeromicrobium sp. Root495]
MPVDVAPALRAVPADSNARAAAISCAEIRAFARASSADNRRTSPGSRPDHASNAIRSNPACSTETPATNGWESIG